jgi:hypothetical protein
VIIELINSGGVISNAGEKTFTPIGAIRFPNPSVISSGFLSSIKISFPSFNFTSIVEVGAAT